MNFLICLISVFIVLLLYVLSNTVDSDFISWADFFKKLFEELKNFFPYNGENNSTGLEDSTTKISKKIEGFDNLNEINITSINDETQINNENSEKHEKIQNEELKKNKFGTHESKESWKTKLNNALYWCSQHKTELLFGAVVILWISIFLSPEDSTLRQWFWYTEQKGFEETLSELDNVEEPELTDKDLAVLKSIGHIERPPTVERIYPDEVKPVLDKLVEFAKQLHEKENYNMGPEFLKSTPKERYWASHIAKCLDTSIDNTNKYHREGPYIAKLMSPKMNLEYRFKYDFNGDDGERIVGKFLFFCSVESKLFWLMHVCPERSEEFVKEFYEIYEEHQKTWTK